MESSLGPDSAVSSGDITAKEIINQPIKYLSSTVGNIIRELWPKVTWERGWGIETDIVYVTHSHMLRSVQLTAIPALLASANTPVYQSNSMPLC